jgi:hypothetical protein
MQFRRIGNLAATKNMQSDASETFLQFRIYNSDASETFLKLRIYNSDASETFLQLRIYNSDASDCIFQPCGILSDASDAPAIPVMRIRITGIKQKGMTCRRYNPVRGCISIEKRVLLPHNPVRGCTSPARRRLYSASHV